MESSSTIERVNQIQFYRWLGGDTSVILSPVKWDTSAMLNIRGVVWIGKEFRTRSMKGCGQYFRDDLLGFNIIRNISLAELASCLVMSMSTYQIICTALQETSTSKVSRPPCNDRNKHGSSVYRKSCLLLVKLINLAVLPYQLGQCIHESRVNTSQMYSSARLQQVSKDSYSTQT